MLEKPKPEEQPKEGERHWISVNHQREAGNPGFWRLKSRQKAYSPRDGEILSSRKNGAGQEGKGLLRQAHFAFSLPKAGIKAEWALQPEIGDARLVQQC